jgi:uncharacterized protein (DUF1800 family)
MRPTGVTISSSDRTAAAVVRAAGPLGSIATLALVLPLVLALGPVPAVAQGAAATGSTRSGAPPRSTVTRPTVREQTADQQVMQVLNRMAFGPRPGEVAAVRSIGVDAWIRQQLDPEHIDDSAMGDLLARYPLVNANQTELAAQFATAQRDRRMMKRVNGDTAAQPGQAADPAFQQIQKQRAQLVAQLMSQRVARAVGSNRQLLEVMTDFWENHFNVYVRKNAVESFYLADYDRSIREHALGKFRDLLGAVAHSPAMLAYLDNAESRANPGEPTLAGRRIARFGMVTAAAGKKPAGLNENYGRELMELHTVGVDGGYTQRDVVEAARALTGWTVRPPMAGGGFVFRPEWHDAGPKTFMGHKLAAGRGEQDGEDVLDILARSPATAHFIALRLAQRFVADTPSAALVNDAARTFLRTDGDIREVVRTIVTSPEFFAASAYHSKVKSPFEVVASTARALGAQADTTPRTALAVAYLGQPIFGHQDPNGWPETGESWMNTGAILTRINFGMAAAAGRLPGISVRGMAGADSLQHAAREVQVDAVVTALLGGAVSPEMRRVLVSGEHPLAANTANAANAANAARMSADGDSVASAERGARRGDAGGSQQAGRGGGGRGSIVGMAPQLTGMAQVVGLALGSPEFQRR